MCPGVENLCNYSPRAARRRAGNVLLLRKDKHSVETEAKQFMRGDAGGAGGEAKHNVEAKFVIRARPTRSLGNFVGITGRLTTRTIKLFFFFHFAAADKLLQLREHSALIASRYVA